MAPAAAQHSAAQHRLPRKLLLQSEQGDFETRLAAGVEKRHAVVCTARLLAKVREEHMLTWRVTAKPGMHARWKPGSLG